jgi:enoyl-CoA hydratase
MPEAPLVVDVRDGVHVLTVTRPERRNALDIADAEAIAAAVGELRAQAPRVVVVTGADGAFCAGAVLEDLFDASATVAQQRDRLQRFYSSFLAIRDLPCPTLAAIEGPAIGGGLNLALACDLRIVSPTAKLGVTFAKLGLNPGGGCSSFLVDAMGSQRALLTLLTGRTLSGQEAFDEGLVALCADDPLAAALGIARTVAALEPELARSIVAGVRIAAREGFDATLDFESWAQAASGQGFTPPPRRA